MRAQLRCELLKQRTTRSTLFLVGWMVALVLLVVLLHDFSLSTSQAATERGQLQIFGWGTTLGVLFAGLLGAISSSGEFRHGTIRPTLLAEPKRSRVIAAKIVTSALTGALLGLLAEALAAGAGSAGLAAREITIHVTASSYLQLVAGGAGAAALWGALGAGVGAIVRNQVATVVGLCIWFLLAEALLSGDLPTVGKFLPGASAGALAGAVGNPQAAASVLAPGFAALVLAGYVAIAMVLGGIAMTQRDVA